VFICAVLLLLVACSGNGDDGDPGEVGDATLIIPDGLSVSALPGGNGVLNLISLTLRTGPTNTELYAALRNDGDVPACHAALSVELFDHAQQSLAAGINGLLSSHFYRTTDGSDAIAACLGPGDVTMAAITDFPADIAPDDVGFAVYRCPYFALDVMPIEGLSVIQVKSADSSAGTTFTGTLVNGFDVAVHDPSVTVFATNRVGRPLGMVIAKEAIELMPGASWTFQTNTVDAPGAFHAAFPAAAISKE
jgi:hypothetical protein